MPNININIMKKLILAAFAIGGIFTISAQVKPQGNTDTNSVKRTGIVTGNNSLNTNGTVNGKAGTMNNSNIVTGSSNSLSNDIRTMNNGTTNNLNVNGALPNNTGVIDNRINSGLNNGSNFSNGTNSPLNPSGINAGTPGTLNTSATINATTPTAIPNKSTGTIKSDIKKTR